jgi:ribosomal protein S18 acetylase RimI-like enzyme
MGRIESGAQSYDPAVPDPLVRPFRPDDAATATALLYESSGGMYDRYAGNRKLAERAIGRALTRDGSTASAEVVWVAELDGDVVGVMAAMPYDEWTPRAHQFLRATLRSIPPWRWPRALWLYRASGRTAPEPPQACFYVDSLATATPHRRLGVARALLAEAERQATARGLQSVALDTWIDNKPARALYVSEGFEEVAYTPAVSGLPGGVSLLKELR